MRPAWRPPFLAHHERDVDETWANFLCLWHKFASPNSVDAASRALGEYRNRKGGSRAASPGAYAKVLYEGEEGGEDAETLLQRDFHWYAVQRQKLKLFLRSEQSGALLAEKYGDTERVRGLRQTPDVNLLVEWDSLLPLLEAWFQERTPEDILELSMLPDRGQPH